MKYKKLSVPERAREDIFMSISIKNEIGRLYDTPRTIKTKKGRWDIFERRSFAIPYFLEKDQTEEKDGFCAAYYKKGRMDPETLFLGELKNRSTIDDTAKILSKNVLEQGFFSRPSRKLTPKEGKGYVRKWGYRIEGLIGAGLLSDIGVSIYAHITNNFNYDGLTWKFVNSMDSLQEEMQMFCLLGIAIGGFTAAAIAPLIAGSMLGERLGRAAERKRVKKLPEEAFSYTYGHNARVAISKEYDILKRESRKKELHDKLKESGYDIPKESTVEIYNSISTIEDGDIQKLSNHIDKKIEPKVPLETIVKVYKKVKKIY